MADIIHVTALPMKAIERKQLAVGMNLGKLAGIIVEAGDETAPHFPSTGEPDHDAGTFPAVNGQLWYRPGLRVASRPSSVGPYVWFAKDAEGVVRLEFALEEVGPAGADGAVPFAVTVDSVTLGWHETDGQHSRAFPNPTLGQSADPSRQPHFLVYGGDRLAPDEVQTIYHALSRPDAQAKLTVAMGYGYWVDTIEAPERQPDIDLPKRKSERVIPWIIPIDPGAAISGPLVSQPLVVARPILSTIAISSILAANTKVLGFEATGETPESFAGGAVMTAPWAARIIDDQGLLELRAKSLARKERHDFKRLSYSSIVAFSFDENLEQHAAIYRAIKGEQLTSVWTETPNGWLRRATYPNTVYRLPDELRLAFNADLGVPHVLPTLYRDDDDEAKIRVVMRILPWHDPEKLVAIGDDLRTAPDVIVGGYESATLSFTGAFPEQIRALSGTSVPISLETGVEVALDLTVEFYGFLCELLTGPIGVTGNATVTLGQTTPTNGSDPQPIVRQVPVLLRFAVPATLPVDVSVPPDAVSPGQVSLINRSGAAATIGGCEPRLLQYDDNSVVPLEIFKARATSTFPVSVAAGATAIVDVSPLDPARALLWNAILAQLTDIRLDLDPQAALSRIYEVAPVGSIEWELAIECPPLAITPPPARFANVIAIDVAVTRNDGGRAVIHLTRSAPTAELTMHRTLAELTSPSGDIGTFTYAVRNLYADHPGSWFPPQEGEGSNLTVYPNDPAND
jgi:hypothetical protein